MLKKTNDNGIRIVKVNMNDKGEGIIYVNDIDVTKYVKSMNINYDNTCVSINIKYYDYIELSSNDVKELKALHDKIIVKSKLYDNPIRYEVDTILIEENNVKIDSNPNSIIKEESTMVIKENIGNKNGNKTVK